ncbi:MAG TPA: SRPBCC family protein [Ktedonobacteraceae bacterium]
MINVEESINISRPIEEVFAYVSNFRNAVEWQSGVVEMRQTPEGPVGIGTQITFVRTFLGRKLEGISEVVEYEPPTKHTLKSTSGLPITVSRIFEPTTEGTKVTFVLEMQPGGFFALAEPLIARMLRRDVVADIGNLKDLLESQVGAATS